MDELLKRTWAEISLDNLRHNYNTIRGVLDKDCLMMAVVKADGYGHGAVPASKFLEQLGADYFGVSNLDEALQLRQAGIKKPVLILGYTPPEFTETLIKNDISQTVYDSITARKFSCAAQNFGGKLKIHVKIDTGMSRLGFIYTGNENIDGIMETVNLPGLFPEGIFTHFAQSEEPEFTKYQLELFTELLVRLKNVNFKIKHCANSGAVINYKETHFNMVRAGLILYGILPDRSVKTDLRPVLKLCSVVSQVKEIEKNTTVSYGRTFTAKQKTKLAVIPAGYADGYMRKLSDRSEVIIGGKKAKITGVICMDMCMADITHIENVRPGDAVTLIGSENGLTVSASDLALMAETIPYEIVCAVSKRVPRLYFLDGKEQGYINYIR